MRKKLCPKKGKGSSLWIATKIRKKVKNKNICYSKLPKIFTVCKGRYKAITSHKIISGNFAIQPRF